MNGKLAVIEEGGVAALVGALVIQLASVNHRLVGPKPVSCPVLLSTKGANV